MIQKLRRKLILIMMIVVTLILLIVFLAMLFTTQRSLERDSLTVLHRILYEEGKAPNGEIGPELRVPAFVLQVDESSQVELYSGYYTSMVEEVEIPQLVAAALQNKDNSGVLSDYGLRFLKQELPEGGARIAFADTSMETNAMSNLLINSLAMGAAALLLFFLLSLFLARWAVRPVERAWAQQRQFVADASHELKTPLTVILSNADMLMAHQNSRWAENIKAEGLRMKTLTEELLCLAASEDAQVNRHLSRVDFSDIVANCLLGFEPVLFESGMRLEEKLEEGLHILGDEGQLRRLVDILLDNAHKYGRPGSAVTVRLQGSPKKSLRLQVRNQGAVIPPEQLDKIFERFYRADSARVGNGSYGLGLAIAKSIVEHHQGRIWAESKEAEGTVFNVSLPLCK